MTAEASVKALVVAFTGDAPAAIYSINRLKPESLCFFLPESVKSQIETEVQPRIAQMPRRWDWLVTPDPTQFMASYKVMARALPVMMQTWDVQAGELVVDVTGATPAMSGALLLASMPYTSRVTALTRIVGDGTDQRLDGETVTVDGDTRHWVQSNPWDEAAEQARHEACDSFNRGIFAAAAATFRQIEARVSGGQKPLYRALADLGEGYGAWERFHYRQAWDKLKGAGKALDMAALWGGPPGLKALLPHLKANASFLERLVIDPQEVKESLVYDLLAHARRRADVDHHHEAALIVTMRALEASAQWQLFRHYKIKTWDVRPEQLPDALREVCRTCLLDDLDGKYKLPLQSQFRALAGLGHDMGQTYLANWAKMKPLLDAAHHAVLAHGFEPVKAERFHQLYELVLKLTGVNESMLPRFPHLDL